MKFHIRCRYLVSRSCCSKRRCFRPNSSGHQFLDRVVRCQSRSLPLQGMHAVYMTAICASFAALGEYLRTLAEHFHLRKHIRCNTRLVRLERRSPGDTGAKFPPAWNLAVLQANTFLYPKHMVPQTANFNLYVCQACRCDACKSSAAQMMGGKLQQRCLQGGAPSARTPGAGAAPQSPSPTTPTSSS